MPPKGKKKRPGASPQASPRTPSSTSRDSESGRGGSTLDVASAAAAAAARFPALVPGGGAGCFTGTVADVGPRSSSRGGRLWLSESAMVAAGLRPGCLVSVSLISSSCDLLGGFPLDDLFEKCSRYFDLDADNDLLCGEAGRSFVVATAFPSREVQKNGIRLSWDLACSLGYPSLGQSLFLNPLNTTQAQKETDDVDILRVVKCKNIFLALVPPKIGPSSGIQPVSDCHSARSGVVTESPKKIPSTPVCRKDESHDFVSKNGLLLCLDPTTASSALADEKINELLQTSALRWLSGRQLLKGNYVPLSMCGKLSLFVVIGAESEAVDVLYDKSSTVNYVENSSEIGEAPVLFLVDRTTKVHLSTSFSSEKLGSDRPGLPTESSMVADKKNEDSNRHPMLGGLSKESETIKEIISFSLADQIDVPRYKGVLLYGPPGTGKTSLAALCAHDAGANLFTINGPEIISQYFGESEQALFDVFRSAKQAAPAVIFIDELDAIAPARKDGGEELSLRLVATLLKLMDEIGPRELVLLIAATNRPDSIDPALRRPGRLDREIEIGVPSPGQRLDILHNLLIGVHHSLTGQELESLAQATHGFVGADLAALCNEAALTALRRYISLKENSTQRLDHHGTDMDKGDNPETLDLVGNQISLLSSTLSKLSMSSVDFFSTKGNNIEGSASSDGKDDRLLLVTSEDFEKAKLKVRPSAMREVMLELPKVHWQDVGGQARVKKQLIEAIQWPQKCPEAFERIGIRPPRGLLMIGPPGCSKTLMARAVASEAKLNFLAVKGPELFSKWVGDSEKAVRSLFAKARANAPAILFFDEIDGLAVTRGHENDGTSVADRVLSQLLVEMDGLDQRIGVTVIAATNRPDKMDHALLRPGRFDRLLDVQPPDEGDREDIFRIHTRRMPCSPDVNFTELARLTEGYTGADIELVCREAAVAALDEDFDILEVATRHFNSAINRIKPSDVKFYQELASQFRRFVDDTSRREE